MMKLAEMCPFVVLCLSEDELKSVYSAVGSFSSFTISSLHHLAPFKDKRDSRINRPTGQDKFMSKGKFKQPKRPCVTVNSGERSIFILNLSSSRITAVLKYFIYK